MDDFFAFKLYDIRKLEKKILQEGIVLKRIFKQDNPSVQKRMFSTAKKNQQQQPNKQKQNNNNKKKTQKTNKQKT